MESTVLPPARGAQWCHNCQHFTRRKGTNNDRCAKCDQRRGGGAREDFLAREAKRRAKAARDA